MKRMLERMLGLSLWVLSVQAWADNSTSAVIDRWLNSDAPKTAYSGKTVEWKFAHPAPPVSHLPPIWQAGFDWLERKTDGHFKVNVYGGGTLYGVAGGVKALRSGIADYGTCYSAMEPKGFELFKTFQVPFVAPSNPFLTARIINELMAEKLKSEFERRGVYPAHVMPVRPLTLMSKTPIRSPEDLKGKKVVSLMNAPGAAKELGFSAVRLPFPEIYTALQQGVVDAVVWVDMGFIPFKIYEQAKYYTAINVAPATLETCFNRKSFDRLPTALKQEVYDFQQKVAISVVHKTEEFAHKAREVFLANDVTVIELDETQRQQWKDAFKPSVEQWMESCEKAGKDCRSLVKDIKRLEKKYAHLSNEELMRLAIEEPVQGMIDF